MNNQEFVFVITLSTSPTDNDKVGCDGLYFRDITSYTPVQLDPSLCTYKGTRPGFIPSAQDLENGVFRLEWSGAGEFHRFYGASKKEAADKWNGFCGFHDDSRKPSVAEKK